ncbi:hypothetical protein WBG78_28740 [Chryseolinea sp. T2]|uniref:hypothetical protein n=1 Tax=Chryseolinea sp. T2 TaxID=3129255 RepID=UPI0030782186
MPCTGINSVTYSTYFILLFLAVACTPVKVIDPDYHKVIEVNTNRQGKKLIVRAEFPGCHEYVSLAIFLNSDSPGIESIYYAITECDVTTKEISFARSGEKLLVGLTHLNLQRDLDKGEPYKITIEDAGEITTINARFPFPNFYTVK